MGELLFDKPTVGIRITEDERELLNELVDGTGETFETQKQAVFYLVTMAKRRLTSNKEITKLQEEKENYRLQYEEAKTECLSLLTAKTESDQKLTVAQQKLTELVEQINKLRIDYHSITPRDAYDIKLSVFTVKFLDYCLKNSKIMEMYFFQLQKLQTVPEYKTMLNVKDFSTLQGLLENMIILFFTGIKSDVVIDKKDLLTNYQKLKP